MVTAILLAAGQSQRMGKTNKLLLTYGSEPMINHQVKQLKKAGISDIIVVLGHEAELVKQTLPANTKTVMNPNYLSGMTSSIQAGVRAVDNDVLGYMICLSDMPLLQSSDYRKLVVAFLSRYEEKEDCIIQPVFEEKRGQPVIFSRYYKTAILNHLEPEGCKGIVLNHPDKIDFIPVDTIGVLRDVDTPTDYDLL